MASAPARLRLRTAEEYLASQRDGRAVVFRRDRIPDVTSHPVLGVAVKDPAPEPEMDHQLRCRDLAVAEEGCGSIVLEGLRQRTWP